MATSSKDSARYYIIGYNSASLAKESYFSLVKICKCLGCLETMTGDTIYTDYDFNRRIWIDKESTTPNPDALRLLKDKLNLEETCKDLKNQIVYGPMVVVIPENDLKWSKILDDWIVSYDSMH